MNASLLKYVGNIDQIAGIRESQLLRGRGEQIQIAEFYNAAGLRFTVVPYDCFGNAGKGITSGFVSPEA